MRILSAGSSVLLLSLTSACERDPHRAWAIAARQDIQALIAATVAYKLDVASFPTTAQGLRALRIMPDGVNHWQGPYLTKDVPMDSWGRPFIYRYPGEHGEEPDIISLGADGKLGGEGINADIVSWK
jgi:general secretion pathway protein G